MYWATKYLFITEGKVVEKPGRYSLNQATSQHHMSSDAAPWGGCHITSLAFRPKRHGPNLRQHNTDPNWEIYYSSKMSSSQKTKKKSEELFKLKVINETRWLNSMYKRRLDPGPQKCGPPQARPHRTLLGQSAKFELDLQAR